MPYAQNASSGFALRTYRDLRLPNVEQGNRERKGPGPVHTLAQ